MPLVSGALLKCSFGVAPSSFIAVPQGQPVLLEGRPCGTIMDNIPMLNIMPFGMCTAPTNPQVIAAQGAPVPCMPVTTSPWIVGTTKAMVNNKFVITNASQLMCTWAGVINAVNAGTTKEQFS